MAGGNAFTWGTHDKFGQAFGVALTRSEVLRRKAMARCRQDPRWVENDNFKKQVRARAMKRPVTKVKFSWDEEDQHGQEASGFQSSAEQDRARGVLKKRGRRYPR